MLSLPIPPAGRPLFVRIVAQVSVFPDTVSFTRTKESTADGRRREGGRWTNHPGKIARCGGFHSLSVCTDTPRRPIIKPVDRLTGRDEHPGPDRLLYLAALRCGPAKNRGGFMRRNTRYGGSCEYNILRVTPYRAAVAVGQPWPFVAALRRIVEIAEIAVRVGDRTRRW
jgi:hypothetical protein